MVAYLCCFVPGVLFGLLLLKRSFETSWKIMTVTVLAAYAALWTMPKIMVKYVSSLEAGWQRGYLPAATLLGLAIVFAVIFGAVVLKTLPGKEIKVQYNKTVSQVSGVLFGFISGSVILSLLIVCVFSTPLINKAARHLPEGNVERAGKFARRVCMHSSLVVDSLTLQRDRTSARAEWLEAFTEILPIPEAPEPAPAAEDAEGAAGAEGGAAPAAGQSAPAARALPQEKGFIKRVAGRATDANDAHQAAVAAQQ